MNKREARGEIDESERGYDISENTYLLEEKISLCLQHCDKLPVDQEGVLILNSICRDEEVNILTRF